MIKFLSAIAISATLLGCFALNHLAQASPSPPQDSLPVNYYEQQQQLQGFAQGNPIYGNMQQINNNDEDSDDGDEDDDIANAQGHLAAMAAQNSVHPTGGEQNVASNSHLDDVSATGNYQQVAPRPSANDLKTAASYHKHHGHGAKGWLDMGAWTGKKGAFGWHDKHPVGGKKGRK